jgi:hypothetical protein
MILQQSGGYTLGKRIRCTLHGSSKTSSNGMYIGVEVYGKWGEVEYDEKILRGVLMAHRKSIAMRERVD